MRVVVTGGGSAGHVIPVLAVAAELKIIRSDIEITFVRQIGDKATLELIEGGDCGDVDRVKAIAAGKFRRFHGVPLYKQILLLNIQLKNLRDGVFFLFGFVQSVLMLLRRRPDVVFVRGGYVGLPVGLAAALLHIPLVIHESDTHMSLTNNILSKYSAAVGVGMPLNNYSLGDVEVKYVGIPVSSDYEYVDKALKAEYKEKLGINPAEKLVVVTGGSLGAEVVNDIVVAIAFELLQGASVIHQTGAETYRATQKAAENVFGGEVPDNYHLLPFIEKDMYIYLGAADVVVTRAGNTVLAELAISAKPLVLIPNPKLVYGHQLTNAAAYEKADAALVVDEVAATKNPQLLSNAVVGLLESQEKSSDLASALHGLAKPRAAYDIAKLILSKS